MRSRLVKPLLSIGVTLFSIFSISPSVAASARHRVASISSMSIRPIHSSLCGKSFAASGGVEARVSRRTSDSWNSGFWINVGKSSNTSSLIVSKGSPVLSHDSVIGVIDYVGNNHSKVRLITDPGVVVSCMKGTQEVKKNHTHTLLKQLELLIGEKEVQKIISKIPSQKETPLIHGEVFGSNYTHYRARSHALSAAGLEGIQKGDLLVTSGWDGIFPEGLKLGIVAELKKNGRSKLITEIQVLPTLLDLDNPCHLTVLPPLGFDDFLNEV